MSEPFKFIRDESDNNDQDKDKHHHSKIGSAMKKAKELASYARPSLPSIPSFGKIKDKVGLKRGHSHSHEDLAKPKPQRQAAVRQRSITDFRDVKLRAVDSELSNTFQSIDSDEYNSFVEE